MLMYPWLRKWKDKTQAERKYMHVIPDKSTVSEYKKNSYNPITSLYIKGYASI